ncbi:HAD-IIA family hydrolase [Bifidobacterium sp.]|uniref:HAD-IIA family hydrolase n=1 Tax=Bifidobacterium sp. TaxID=41200 RepID=UPI0025BE5566|nr:HAD-IIA family hydrolase [Bifidobacterium sp.]MCH4208642.1 HAD-IIA family hydrolase [Bifidobacterium sp.]MCI1224386.1 HAD-IIA family hydrolase [Bifidobacterium sp.]
MSESMKRRGIQAWLTDMDGVLVHEDEALPGAIEFIEALKEAGTPFLVLTNNSIFSRRDLNWRLHASGIDIPEENIWTSALATAEFVNQQMPGGKAYVVGEAGLTTALHDVGYVLTDKNPDYVIIGETRNYSFEQLTRALQLIQGGARFICTNPDYTGPSSSGDLLAAGAVAEMIHKASGFEPYFIGKPNPIFFRTALNKLAAHSKTTAMIGDRLDTDIRAGLEAGVETFLVLTGISKADSVDKYPYKPSHVVKSIKDLIPLAQGENPDTLEAPNGISKPVRSIQSAPLAAAAKRK